MCWNEAYYQLLRRWRLRSATHIKCNATPLRAMLYLLTLLSLAVQRCAGW